VEPLDRRSVAGSGDCQEVVGGCYVGAGWSGADSAHRPHIALRFCLELSLECRPRPVAMLDGDDVQRVGQHEPLAEPIAQRLANPLLRGRIPVPHSPKQRLGLVAVVLDAARVKLVMKLEVHSSSLSARVRSLGQEVRGPHVGF
jgi:hypothetical protein